MESREEITKLPDAEIILFTKVGCGSITGTTRTVFGPIEANTCYIAQDTGRINSLPFKSFIGYVLEGTPAEAVCEMRAFFKTDCTGAAITQTGEMRNTCVRTDEDPNKRSDNLIDQALCLLGEDQASSFKWVCRYTSAPTS